MSPEQAAGRSNLLDHQRTDVTAGDHACEALTPARRLTARADLLRRIGEEDAAPPHPALDRG